MDKSTGKRESFLIRMAANMLRPGEYDEEKAWKRVRRQTVDKRMAALRLKWLKYAAIFIIGAGASWWGVTTLKVTPLDNTPQMAVIRPADSQAELVLATGLRMLLNDSVHTGEIAEGGMKLQVTDAGKRLEYDNIDTLGGEKITGYNTLSVKKGGRYMLVLPDGTEVILNSESSLRFPVAFGKGKREVFLEGEGFFKVTPDKNAPFHVHAGGREICVLGTTFDMCAYKNEPYFSTTLVTGKVKVSGGKREAVLLPSEQYCENQQTGAVEVKKVDVLLYTSWMDGKIIFKSERLEDIVKKLARWFEFEIFYANEEVKDMRFRGVIYKEDPFAVVLKKLEQTTQSIRFTIQGSTVIARKIYNN